MKKLKTTNKLSRRKFIDNTAKGAAAVVGLSLLDSQLLKASEKSVQANSKVVIVTDNKILNTSNVIVKTVAQSMVDAGIREVTGIQDIGEAWKSLFPGITQTSKICIKINCINGGLSSHPDVAYSITAGLAKMKFGTVFFPLNNITIFDRTNSEVQWNGGYTINKSTTGVKVYGTDDASAGYGTASYTIVGSTQHVSKILENSDYMINLSVLKDHSEARATLCMKNHFGTINDCGGLHGGGTNNAIVQLNNMVPIKSKQKIFICEAIFGIISGGPGGDPQVTPKSLIFSTDPVAADTIGYNMLKSNGCTQSFPTYITTASQAPYSLGNTDLKLIDQVTITNPSSATEIEENVVAGAAIHTAYPNPFSDHVVLEYQLYEESKVRIEIIDMLGASVNILTDANQPTGYYQLIWDGAGNGGNLLSNGIYMVLYTINDKKFTSKIQLQR